MRLRADARCIAIAATLFAWLAGACAPAQADGSGPITSFPMTGAYQARQVEDRNHVSIIELTGNYNRNLDGGALNVEPRAIVSQEFFRNHPDNYDFIVVFSGFEFDTGRATAFHWSIKNAVEGIGVPQFDAGASFGSPAKLQGFIDMAALTRYVTDPLDPRFETVLSALTHELLHQWASHVRVKNADGSLSDVLLGRDGSHWSFLLDSGASVGYGNQWKDNGDGTFSSTATRKFLSPLDLYLMGFYKPEEVPPFFVIDNPEIDKTRLPEENVTITGTKRIITIDDVIAAEGPRVPAAGEAQNEFRMAFVLLIGPSQRATDAQIAAINRVRDAFMTRFAILTGGRATAQVYPEALPTVEAGVPTVVQGGELRAGQASLDEGLAWLRAHQNTGGNWADKDTTRVRDTVVALRTLAQLDLGFTNAPAALQWLSQQEGVNADYLARTTAVLSQLGGDSSPLRQRLLALQNGDGGFGIAQAYRSDPLDTALAVLALSGAPDPATAVDKAKQYMYAKQNEDGSWSGAEGGAGRTSVTSTVLEALKEGATKEAPAVAKALSWLAGKQNADGGFGDSPSTTHDTANVLQVFMTYDALAGVQADGAAGYLLSRQTVDGSWEGSAYATALAVAALKRFNFPNWALSAPVAAPATPRDGDRVALSITVRNDANAIAPATVLRVYDGEPDNGGKPIGTDIPLPPLAPGSGVTVTPLWDTFNKAGTHTLVAVVDPESAQSELSERDNVSALTLTVASAPATSDLAVVTTDIAIAPIQPNLLPITLGLSATIRNLGQTDVAGVRVVLWEGPIGTGKLVAETIIGVPNRSTSVANFTYELTKPGTTSFTIQIDPDNAIAEASEGNNNAVATVTTAPSIDIAVTAADILLDKDPALVGSDATFKVLLHNRGTMDSPAAAVNYLISDGTTSTVIRTNTLEVPAGESIEQTIAWRVDRPGSLTFSVNADSGQHIPELDEGNNTASLSFTSNLPSGINLAVDYKDISFTPNPGLEGRDAIIAATIRNPGTVAAENVDVVFYAGDPAQGAPRIGTTQTIATLSAGGSAAASVTWPVLTSPGSKLVYVVVDPQNAIAEFTKDDNAAFEVLEVLSLPDLAISSTDILVSPNAPKTGDTLTISARVTNLGDQPAQDVLVRLFDGDPAAGGKQIDGEKVVPFVAPRATGMAEFTWAFDAAPGAHTLYVRVDPLNTINERSRTNNSARREIAVQNSDLYLSQPYFSPNNDAIKDTTLFSFRLAAPTTVSVVVLDDRDRVVRRYEGPQFADITAGEVVWDGLDDRGRLVADGAHRLQVVDPTQTMLSEVSAVVDTNRWPLLESIGTKYERFINTSCEGTVYSIGGRYPVTESEHTYFTYSMVDNSYLPKGIYRMETTGESRKSIIPTANPKAYYPYSGGLRVAKDGSTLVFVSIDGYSGGYLRSYWLADGDGSNLRQLSISPTLLKPEIHGITPDGRYVLMFSEKEKWPWGYRVDAYPTDGSSPHLLVEIDRYVPVDKSMSPDGKKLFAKEYDPATRSFVRPVIVDISTGQKTYFNGIESLSDHSQWEWSTDSRSLAAHDGNGKRIVVVDTHGNLVKEFSFTGYLQDIAWSPYINELAFVQTSYPYNDAVSGIYVANIETGTVVRVLKIVGGTSETTDGVPFDWNLRDYITWAPAERALIYTYSSTDRWVIFLDKDNLFRRFLGQWGKAISSLTFSPTGRYMIFGAQPSPTQATVGCSLPYSWEFRWAYESLLNLGTDLKLVRSVSAGGILLKGSAADQNFASYHLEYAYAAAPSAWYPVAPPANQAVVDNLFTTWVPPGPGTYLVRLTVEDLAGNRRQLTKRITWSDLPSITDVFRTPAVISPNGDGVQDATTIHYRVLEPIHLEFKFYNTQSEVVRTIEREHVDIGAEFDLIWDGRDDAGTPLPDGEYRMVVNGSEFYITVDTTLPIVTIGTEDAYQRHEDGVTVKVAPALLWTVQDTLYLKSAVEAGDGESPTWALFHKVGMDQRGDGAVSKLSLSIADFTLRRFRYSADDAGANRASAISVPSNEQFIVSAFGNARFNPSLKDMLGPLYEQGPTREAAALLADQGATVAQRGGYFASVAGVPYAPMSDTNGGSNKMLIELGQVRFKVAETIRSRLLQISVQFRPKDAADWQESVFADVLSANTDVPIYFIEPPDHELGLVWDLKGVRAGTDYVVRLKGADASGRTHYSNSFQFTTKGLAFYGLGSERPSSGEYTLVGEEFISEPLSEVRLYFSSIDDPRYAVEQEVGVLAYPEGSFTYKAPLVSCRSYTGYLVAQTESRYDAVTKQYTSETIKTGRVSFRAPCLELGARVDRAAAASCDAQPSGKISIKFAPMSLDGKPLKLLTLSRLDPKTGEDVLFNVNQPKSVAKPAGTGEPEYIYEHVLGSADLPEGEYRLTARLLNVDNHETVVSLNPFIDHTPAAISLSYPQEGQRLCGVPKTWQDGSVHNVLTLEGAISDAGGFHYVMDIAPNVDSSDYEVLHNSRRRDSRLEAAGLPGDRAFSEYHLKNETGPLAAVIDRHGDMRIHLQVTDLSGHQQCLSRSFYFDGKAEVLPASVSTRLFSPNLDGVQDDVTVNYDVEESVTLDIDIHAATRNERGEFTLGAAVHKLEKGLVLSEGSGATAWSGEDDTGRTVADGWYGIVLMFKDGCGNLDKQAFYVEVDNTPPLAVISYPKTTDPLAVTVEIRGSAKDAHLNFYAIDVGTGDAPEAWLRLSSGSKDVTESVLARWNTFGLEGPYTIRLMAADKAGNESELELPLSLAERANLISYFETNSDFLSPNDDGKRESVSLRFGNDQETRIKLTIQNAAGTIVRKLIDDATMPVGPAVVGWDGRGADGGRVPDGAYTAVLSAALATNLGVTQEEQISLVVDGTAPVIQITQPRDGYAQAAGGIAGNISDSHLGEYSVSVAAANAAWTPIDSGASGPGSIQASLDGLAEGDYTLKVEAIDQGETSADLVVPFVIDNTPPKVTISAPVAGEIFGSAKGKVKIEGLVEERNLKLYRLHVGQGETPTSWADLATGTDGRLPSPVTDWDITGATDGAYTLELIAEDKAGSVGESRVMITVDNTAPIAQMSLPANLYVTAPVDISGTANDSHFAEYRLLIAPGTPGDSDQWSEIAVSMQRVQNNVLLSWQALPLDGIYTLKLRVLDRAGNTAEAVAKVVVDTRPPAMPQGLSIAVENRNEAYMTWQPNTEPDLAGYVVYRDGQPVNSNLITAAAEYRDAGLGEGRFVYTVKAVDHAGWESSAPDPVQVAIDVTPPSARIQSPGNGGFVSSLTEISGTAHSSNDFKEYRLYVGEGASPTSWQLLSLSPVPVQSGPLGTWNTLSLPENGVYSLRLETEDINGNIGNSQISVTIDNRAPGVPDGLMATVSGNSVQLAWNANGETDLLGYLLYRDDKLVNSTDFAISDPRQYAINGTAYLDKDVPDGRHSYLLVAIDNAGNVSGASTAITVTIDFRAPKATITQPSNYSKFEGRLHITATTLDADVSRVQFQYKSASVATWTNLGPPDTTAPYDAYWDPTGSPYGYHNLRAIATDEGNKTDSSPSATTVIYADLTKPMAAQGLQVQVQGSEATLTWLPNAEVDLKGYNLYRQNYSGSKTKLTSVPVTGTTYVDRPPTNSLYRYTVTAVDLYGNESISSAEAEALVYAPVLAQPVTPTNETAATVRGTSIRPGQLVAEVFGGGSTKTLPAYDTDAEGRFILPDVPLEPGTNTITARVLDAAGNLSKPASTNIIYATAPSVPTGLAASVAGYAVSLTWNANPEANILGYRLFRNGTPKHADASAVGATASASSGGWASRTIDNNLATYWFPNTPSIGQWIMFTWTQAKIVTGIHVDWANEQRIAVDYDIEAWDGAVWVPLIEVRDNATKHNELAPPRPYRTAKLRLKLLRPLTPDSVYDNVQLAEFKVFHRPYNSTTALTETVQDGLHAYTVTALNTDGFESVPSSEIKVAVGDATPPEPVTIAADVMGSQVQLTWTASISVDVTRYDIYRDESKIGEVADLAFADSLLPNGTYRYMVKAVDAGGNESGASNEVSVSIAVAPPAAPRNLTVAAVPAGEALDLAWQAPEGDAPAGYRILRSTTSGGPYLAIPSSTTEAVMRDIGLTNGILYHYVVVALDTAGNMSAYSNEASALCSDAFTAMPDIYNPTIPGIPLITKDRVVTVVGRAEPGSMVFVDDNGTLVAQTTTSASRETRNAALSFTPDRLLLAPGGQRFVYATGNAMRVYDFSVNAETHSLAARYGVTARPSWNVAGDEILYEEEATNWNFGTKAYRLSDGTSRWLTDTASSDVHGSALSPSGKQLAAVAYKKTDSGVWVFGVWAIDLTTTTWRLLAEVQSGQWFDSNVLVWSPDSHRLVYRRTGSSGGLEMVDVASGAKRVIDAKPGNSLPDWSPDNRSLTFTSIRDGVEQVYRYEISDGAISALTQGPNKHWAPQWSPDGNSLVYFAADHEPGKTGMLVHELSVGDIAPIEISASIDGRFLQWTEGDYLSYVLEGRMQRVALPGRFELKGVPLEAGDNVITAVARDAAGNISQPSRPIVITYDDGDRPDLALSAQDLVLLPAMPLVGQPAAVSVTLRNTGALAASSVPISLLALDANGQGISLLETQTAVIAPGQTQAFSVEWTPAAAGVYTLVAMVDPYNAVTEVSDANNLALREVVVASEAAPSVLITLDRAGVGPNEALTGRAILTNSGDAFTGTFVLAAEDDAGYVVETLDTKSVSLAYGERVEELVSWNTGTTFAGAYRVHAKLLNSQGAIVAEGMASFTLNAGNVISPSVTTDRASYGANEDVAIQGGITYTSGNEVISGATLSLKVEDAAGAVLAEKSELLGDLLPGATSVSTLIFNTSLSPIGAYTLKLALFAGENVLSQAEASFAIEPSGAILKGTLALSDAAPAPGTPQIVRYTVRNLGNTASAAHPVRILLLDADGQVLATQTHAYDLGVGQEVADTATFDTTSYSLGAYTARLEGQAGPETYVTLATSSFTLVDRTAPELTLMAPAAGGFLGSTKALVLARDALSGVATVELRVDSGAWLPASVHDAAAALYGANLVQPEGSHAIEARAIDMYGNSAIVGPVVFTVDTTAPVISIGGVANDGLYNHDVVPTVTISDAYLKSQAVAINGGVYVAPVTEEGVYQLAVSAEDDAGNRADQVVWFMIDKTAPVIAITGIEEGGLYNKDVTPIVTISDVHLTEEAITLNGEPFASGTSVNVDDTYTLVATAEDGATNVSTTNLTFTVDKTSPGAPIVTHPVEGGVVNDRLIGVTGQSEPGATVFLVVAGVELQALADDQGVFSFPAQPFLDGEHTITLFARDRAGNAGLAINVRFSVVTAELAGSVRAPRGVLVLLPGEDPDDRLRVRLEEVFAERNAGYLFTHDEDAFIAALRTHRYATVLLTERHAGACAANAACPAQPNHLKLSAVARTELRANVAAGTGLIWIKPNSDANEHFADVLGAKTQGLLPGLTGLTLPDSPASSAGAYTLTGVGVRAKPLTGQPVGQLASTEEPALILHTYGAGPVVLVAFDPAALEDTEAAKTVLTRLLSFAVPADSVLLPGGFVEISFHANRLRPPVTVRLDENLDPALTVVAALGGQITDPHAATWTRLLDAAETTFVSLARLPQTRGSYPITARLAEQRGNTLLPLVEKTLTVTLAIDRDTLGAVAMDTVANIAATKTQDVRRREQALTLVHEALLLPLAKRADATVAIDKLLAAIDLLQSTENGGGAIKVIGELLGALEVAWVNFE